MTKHLLSSREIFNVNSLAVPHFPFQLLAVLFDDDLQLFCGMKKEDEGGEGATCYHHVLSCKSHRVDLLIEFIGSENNTRCSVWLTARSAANFRSLWPAIVLSERIRLRLRLSIFRKKWSLKFQARKRTKKTCGIWNEWGFEGGKQRVLNWNLFFLTFLWFWHEKNTTLWWNVDQNWKFLWVCHFSVPI